jgi:ribosomal protein S11
MKPIKKLKVTEGICYVAIGKSNIIFSVTDIKGNQLFWLRPAMLKFKGSKQRFSSFAMERIVYTLIRKLILIKILKLHIVYSGFFKKWIGKTIGLAFRKQKVYFLSSKYRNARPHGFMRPRKKRRL